MGWAVVVVLPLAVGALLASLPVVAMAAVLATLNSRSVLRSFTAGWLAGLLTTALVALLLVDVVSFASDSVNWISWLRLPLGIALLVLGIRKFLQRPRGDGERPSPSWMTTMQTIGPGKAFGVAFLLGSVNPKNAVIVLSAVSSIVYTSVNVGEQVVAALVFVVVASLGVVAPAVLLRASGERAAAPLERFVGWFARYSDVILAVVIALIGVLMLANGLSELLAG